MRMIPGSGRFAAMCHGELMGGLVYDVTAPKQNGKGRNWQ
jgi:hypothetical protein